MTTEVRVDLSEYSDRFLTCRALQHIWVPRGLPWLEPRLDVQIVMERFRCTRCGAERTDQRSVYGRFLRRSYKHESGYKLGQELNRKDLHAGERYRRILGDSLLTETRVSA